MISGKKLLLACAIALVVSIGFIAYSRSSQQTEAPQPETATVPVESTGEALPGGEPSAAAPSPNTVIEAIPPADEPAPENGQPAQ